MKKSEVPQRPAFRQADVIASFVLSLVVKSAQSSRIKVRKKKPESKFITVQLTAERWRKNIDLIMGVNEVEYKGREPNTSEGVRTIVIPDHIKLL